MRTLTQRLSDGMGKETRKGTRQGKAQQGRESLKKMLNFFKFFKEAEERGKPPFPEPHPPIMDRYPLTPRGNVSGNLRTKES